MKTFLMFLTAAISLAERAEAEEYLSQRFSYDAVYICGPERVEWISKLGILDRDEYFYIHTSSAQDGEFAVTRRQYQFLTYARTETPELYTVRGAVRWMEAAPVAEGITRLELHTQHTYGGPDSIIDVITFDQEALSAVVKRGYSDESELAVCWLEHDRRDPPEDT